MQSSPGPKHHKRKYYPNRPRRCLPSSESHPSRRRTTPGPMTISRSDREGKGKRPLQGSSSLRAQAIEMGVDLRSCPIHKSSCPKHTHRLDDHQPSYNRPLPIRKLSTETHHTQPPPLVLVNNVRQNLASSSDRDPLLVPQFVHAALHPQVGLPAMSPNKVSWWCHAMRVEYGSVKVEAVGSCENGAVWVNYSNS